MHAMAFNGLLHRYMRGPTQPAQETHVLAAKFRKLADAVKASMPTRRGPTLSVPAVKV